MLIAERRIATEPAFYAWSFPSAPIQIHLSLDVVERLQPHLDPFLPLVEGKLAQPRGLLIGRTKAPGVTEIVDFEPLPAAGWAELKQAMANLLDPANGLGCVGYYHIDRGPGLSLKDADLQLANDFFHDPSCVFLKIQPRKYEPANAGFFFWDGAQLNGEFCFMEFPFEAGLLAAERHSSSAPDLAEPPTPSSPAARAMAVFRRTPRAVLTGALVAVAVLSAGTLWILRAPPKGVPGMRVERQGQSLSLTWDRKSRPVVNAQAATLSIRDGALTRTISLDAMHLRSGSISYSPVASPVEFELALIARNGSVSRDETIAVPLPVSAVQPVIAPLPPAEVPRQEARNPGHASKPRWVPSVAISSAPAAKAPVTAPAGSLPLAGAKQGSAHQTTEAKAEGLIYSPPKPLSQVAPVVPSNLARLIRQETVVVVSVSIDTAGNVVQATPAANKMSAFLIPAALTAARQWTFQPAREGSQKLPAETILRFRFIPYRAE